MFFFFIYVHNICERTNLFTLYLTRVRRREVSAFITQKENAKRVKGQFMYIYYKV